MENVHRLKIVIPPVELWDESAEEFLYSPGGTLELEHSLAAISKWEALTCLPFFSNDDKSLDQTIEYIKCMTVNEVDPSIYDFLTPEVFDKVTKYINAPMTATWFAKKNEVGGPKRVVTSELVYFWMLSNNIPFECEHWHFNRLMTLIRVCNEENKPKDKNKKLSRNDISARALLNQQRRKAMRTKG